MRLITLHSTRLRREKILILGLVLLLVITLNNSWQQNPHLVTPRALKETPSEAQRETLRETAPPNKTQTLIEETLKANQEAIGQDKNETAPVCRCVTSSWLESDFISPYLSLTMPWDNTTIYRELQERHPNLPVELLSSKVKKRCSLLPTIFSTAWRNEFWQKVKLDNGSLFLYSAFYDPESPDGRASIRLLGVSRSEAPAPAWCHIWFTSDAPPLPVRVTSIDYLDYQIRNSDRQMPYLLKCVLPRDTSHTVPFAVSLVSEPCAPANNLLKVIGERERGVSAYRDGKVPVNPSTLARGWAVAVCGPALYYYHEDFSLRLVEWLEVLRAQGFSQVFLYATDVHPNITKVLRHYTQEGFVQVTDYSYPPPYVNEPNLRRLWTLVERKKMFAQENVYFTDCVLRHMHQYRFLVHFDPDEVPILPHHHNFTHFLDDLIANTRLHSPGGFKLRRYYFYDNLQPSEKATHLPSYLWLLRHTRRLAHHLPGKRRVGEMKPIHDMNAIRGVFSHSSLLCVSGRCHSSTMQQIPTKLAFHGHFRLTCDEECQQNTKHDLTLQRYWEQVSARVLRVLKTLHLV